MFEEISNLPPKQWRLFSSVVEHWSRKPGAVSSILTGGKIFFQEWIESQFTREETGFICAQGLAYCSFDQMSKIFFKQPDSTPNYHLTPSTIAIQIFIPQPMSQLKLI